jgi:hypothetical protein
LLTDGEGRIVNVFEGKNLVDKCLREHLQLIRCECGEEILVVPDLKARIVRLRLMLLSIERKRCALRGMYLLDRISHLLSQITLLKMSEQKNTS